MILALSTPILATILWLVIVFGACAIWTLVLDYAERHRARHFEDCIDASKEAAASAIAPELKVTGGYRGPDCPGGGS